MATLEVERFVSEDYTLPLRTHSWVIDDTKEVEVHFVSALMAKFITGAPLHCRILPNFSIYGVLVNKVVLYKGFYKENKGRVYHFVNRNDNFELRITLDESKHILTIESERMISGLVDPFTAQHISHAIAKGYINMV